MHRGSCCELCVYKETCVGPAGQVRVTRQVRGEGKHRPLCLDATYRSVTHTHAHTHVKESKCIRRLKDWILIVEFLIHDRKQTH